MIPVYKQTRSAKVVEKIKDAILSGKYKAGDKIASVRELATELEINPNTVVKGYDNLMYTGIIYSKLTIGFFVTPEAFDLVRKERKASFFDKLVPLVTKEMGLLGISVEELTDELKNRIK